MVESFKNVHNKCLEVLSLVLNFHIHEVHESTGLNHTLNEWKFQMMNHFILDYTATLFLPISHLSNFVFLTGTVAFAL